MEGDVEFVHREAVVDLEGKMIEKDCFVSFEQKPVFDLTDDVLLTLGLLILLSDGFVYVLFFALVGVPGLHD